MTDDDFVGKLADDVVADKGGGACCVGEMLVEGGEY